MIKDKHLTPRIYKFINDEFFIYCNIKNHEGKTCLYKIRGEAGSGQSMLGGYIIGFQRFDSFITAMAYIEGYVFIGFDDGRILKVNGTGGGGENMFAIQKTANGFKTVTGYNYLVGSHKFNSALINITYHVGNTFISFDNKKILKINNSGGGGYNLFAIIETTNGFLGLPGYNYYSGHQKLDAIVTNVITNEGYIFISSKDGRIMKIQKNGGTGANMFAITETNYGYKTLIGYNYLAGTYKFSDYVVFSLVAQGVMFFSFADKHMIKIKGSGGTGQNLFNIKKTSIGYTTFNFQYNAWLLGSQLFFDVAREMAFIQGNLFISFPENVEYGGIYKYKGLGGTGLNMFNIFNNSNYPKYYLGKRTQKGSAQIIFFDNKLFWCISEFKYKGGTNWLLTFTVHGFVVKLNGSDGPQENIFALKIGEDINNVYSITGLQGYSFWEGTESRFSPSNVPMS